MRDRAIVYVLLSTGLRREELVTLDVTQVSPSEPGLLREAKRARLTAVVGKGGTTRTVFLSADARTALADYSSTSGPETRPAMRRRCSCRPRGRVAPAWRAALAAVDQRRSWSGSVVGMTPSTAIRVAESVRCARTLCATRSRSRWPRPRARTPTSSSGGSGIARSATSRATPTRRRRSPPPTSRRCEPRATALRAHRRVARSALTTLSSTSRSTTANGSCCATSRGRRGSGSRRW